VEVSKHITLVEKVQEYTFLLSLPESPLTWNDARNVLKAFEVAINELEQRAIQAQEPITVEANDGTDVSQSDPA